MNDRSASRPTAQKPSPCPPTALALLALAWLPLADPAAGPSLPAPGVPEQESPPGPESYAPVQGKFPIEFHFQRPPEPDPGVRDIEDLFGRPILVLYWRADDTAAPERLKQMLAALEDRGDSIWMLGLERSELDQLAYERLLWNQGLTKTPLLWSREEAVPRLFQHPAQLMILNHLGKVCYSSAWAEDPAATLEALDLAIVAAHHPLEVTNKKLVDIWEEFRDGKWDRAYTQAIRARDKARDKLAKKPTDSESLEVSTQAGSLALEIEAQGGRLAKRCKLLVERGDFAQAKALYSDLKAKRPKESKDYQYLLDGLDPLFDGKVPRDALLAAERFAPIWAAVLAEGPRAHVEQLKAYLEQFSSGFCATRAQRLIELFPE